MSVSFVCAPSLNVIFFAQNRTPVIIIHTTTTKGKRRNKNGFYRHVYTLFRLQCSFFLANPPVYVCECVCVYVCEYVRCERRNYFINPYPTHARISNKGVALVNDISRCTLKSGEEEKRFFFLQALPYMCLVRGKLPQ